MAAVVLVWALAANGSIPTAPIERLGPKTLNLPLSGLYSTVTLSNISVGRADGLSFALYIHPDATTTSFEIEEMVVDNLTCPGFNVTSTAIAYLTMTGLINDGISLGYAVTSTPDVIVGSLRGAGEINQRDNRYDWVNLHATSDTVVKKFVLEGFNGASADCWLEGLDIGTLTVTGGRVGSGTGINNFDVIFDNSVTVGSEDDVSGNFDDGVNVR